MRILHTSDWHLGRTFHGRVLDEAHAVIADHLVELAGAEDVENEEPVATADHRAPLPAGAQWMRAGRCGAPL